MEIYENDLKQMLKELKKLKRRYSKELETSPQGSLHRMARKMTADGQCDVSCCDRSCAVCTDVNVGKYAESIETVTYIWALKNEDGKVQRKSVTKDAEFLRLMARKAYIKKVLRSIERDIEVVERAAKSFVSLSPESIMKKIPSAYKDMPREYFVKEGTDGTE